jgi:hypothetical protein
MKRAAETRLSCHNTCTTLSVHEVNRRLYRLRMCSDAGHVNMSTTCKGHQGHKHRVIGMPVPPIYINAEAMTSHVEAKKYARTPNPNMQP